MENEKFENEVLLLAALKLDSHEAFIQIFRKYYPDLVLFASRFILDTETCEDIVQEAFIKIWSNRKILEIRTSLKTYLISLVQHLALNEIKHRKVKTLYQDMYHEMILALPADEHILYTELNDAVENLLSQLDPEVLEITHVNLNDHSIEGFRSKKVPMIAVQFHPEAAPGPHDSNPFFEDCRKLVLENKK